MDERRNFLRYLEINQKCDQLKLIKIAIFIPQIKQSRSQDSESATIVNYTVGTGTLSILKAFLNNS